MGVEAAIYTRLTGFSALTALLSSATSVYPDVAGQGVDQPYVVFTFIDGSPTRAMGGNVDPTDIFMDVASVADDKDACVAVADQVKAALDWYSGTLSGTVVQRIFYDGGPADVFDDDRKYFQRTLDFRIHYEE